MIHTIRGRLFLWFLFFISFSLVIVLVTYYYNDERRRITDFHNDLAYASELMLRDVKTQRDFFYYETTNPKFFVNRSSPYVVRHDSLVRTLRNELDRMESSGTASDFGVSDELDELNAVVSKYDSTFHSMIDALLDRGFKDFGIVGRMRFFAHALENLPVPAEDVLMLRRMEKDYIIRNEDKYVYDLLEYGEGLREEIGNNPELTAAQKDTASFFLNSYLESFESLVEADLRTGIRNRSGLRKKLDDQTMAMETVFEGIRRKANERESEILANVRMVYVSIIVLMLLLGVLLSILISAKVTKPIKMLSAHISRFVDSNFTRRDELPVPVQRDEISTLTKDFGIMKSEILHHIDDLEQKVHERTAALERANDKLARSNRANRLFVPMEFLNFLGYKSILDVKLGDQVETEMTVLFADIRSFSSLSESMSPEDNFAFLNGYLNRIGPVIRENNGFVDKYLGDGIMALFPYHPDDALKAAMSIFFQVEEYNAFRAGLGYDKEIKVGIGIHKGKTILGTIGESERMDTTVISDAVNVAARLENMTKYYQTGVLLSRDVIDDLEKRSSFEFRFIDAVKVYGKSKPTFVYELLDTLPEFEREIRMNTREAFERYVELLASNDLEQAEAGLSEIVKDNPNDHPASVLLGRCYELMRNGKPTKGGRYTSLDKY